MQTNKQTKQNCLRATTNHSNRTPQRVFQTFFFRLFYVEPASWSSSNAFVSGAGGRSEVRISGRSNRTQCGQRLATAATFSRTEICCPQAQWRGDGARQLATCFGVLQQVWWKIWFGISFWFSIKINLVYFFGLHLKLTKKRYSFSIPRLETCAGLGRIRHLEASPMPE